MMYLIEWWMNTYVCVCEVFLPSTLSITHFIYHIHTTCEYITFNHFLKPVSTIAKSHINFFYKKFAVKLLCPKFCIIQWKSYENMMPGCWGMLKKYESVSKQASNQEVSYLDNSKAKRDKDFWFFAFALYCY